MPSDDYNFRGITFESRANAVKNKAEKLLNDSIENLRDMTIKPNTSFPEGCITTVTVTVRVFDSVESKIYDVTKNIDYLQILSAYKVNRHRQE